MTFDGFVDQGGTIIPGLSADLTLTLTGITDPTHWVFSYDLTNTSSSPITASSITALGFNVSSALDLSTSTVSGDFGTIAGGQISQGPGFAVDICAKTGPNNNNCAGGQPPAIAFGESGSGTLTLELLSGASSLTLSDYTIRWQAITGAAGTPESAIGQVTNVPEPATWAMMLLGFGATGFVIRRSRRPLVAQIA